MTDRGRSRELLAQAEALMPGGVSSPVRAFRAVGGTPPFIASAHGARVVDEDGHEYVDFVLAYGPHILGHDDERIVAALREQIDRGVAFGAPTRLEVELARRVVDAVQSIDMVRFVNSGTEATMSAGCAAKAPATASRSLYGSVSVCAATAAGTPGEPGMPSVATPLPASLRSRSA